MQSSVNQKESRTFFGHPYPLGSLFFTEMWERFSFYGIRPLLILFMAATVYDGGMGLRVKTPRRLSVSLPVPCTWPRCRGLAGG
jgi:dipeptide/tripeptide permease